MRTLPDKITPLAPDEAIAATLAAYRQVLGRAPSARTLAILVAHTALECGQWRALHHYNLGNIKGAHPLTGLATLYPCDEILSTSQAERELAVGRERPRADGSPSAVTKASLDGGRKLMQFYPPHPQCVFRAYTSAREAFEDYIGFLAVDTTPDNGRPNRYAAAWAAAEAGDLRAFVFELHTAGYMTASPAVYYDGGDGPGGRGGMLALVTQYEPLCARALAPADAPPSGLARVEELLTAALAEVRRARATGVS